MHHQVQEAGDIGLKGVRCPCRCAGIVGHGLFLALVHAETVLPRSYCGDEVEIQGVRGAGLVPGR